MDHNEFQERTPLEKHRRTKAIIIACFLGGLLLMLLFAAVPNLLSEGGGERETVPPVDPEKLCDTKEEGFDIFEYEDAVKAATVTESSVVNNSEKTLYIKVNGKRITLFPHDTYNF